MGLIDKSSHRLPSILRDAATHRRRLQKKSHSQRYKIGSHFAVFKNPEQYAAFHALVFHYRVERRLPKFEYPPVGYWIAEDAATFRICDPFFRKQDLHDPRRHGGQRHDVHLLNTTMLSLVIPEDLNVVLYDLDSRKPFASIIRNFSNSQPMLRWMKSVVDEAVGSRRTARKEDPGQLVQVGWTTGARNNPSFDAARNLLRPGEDTTEADKENAFATAYFWRRVQLLHPPEVGDSIAGFYKEHNIPRLDPDWPATRRVHGPVSVPTDTEPITFQDAEFAPGCLVMTERYCRPVHREAQPHEWSVLWTTLREGTDPRGGHFYIPSYGVCIRTAQDTSIAWKPSDYHTTSLGSYDPNIAFARNEDDETMNQQGIAFVTSNKIASVWAEFARKKGLTGLQRVEGALAMLAKIDNGYSDGLYNIVPDQV
ncbi:hypothetical protein BKA70DRAFT_1131291 [Coprinopsis sp. MPI-PUGE-AT-0042]|nr:hypothetical protein BKA70DRAFT_1131291 [Coprinopsis sp. MPI-PUGE-AT-0042]